MKGIILAAGKGTRLYPATIPTPKPLLPIYDKPMIYYSLSLMIMSGIRRVLIVTPAGQMQPFMDCFGDGERLGMYISYKEQTNLRGIADAFLLGRRFIGDDSVCLALGDNLFYRSTTWDVLKQCRGTEQGASIFGYKVADPRPFGVVEFDSSGKAVSLEEKPEHPKSNYIVPGLYYYDNEVVHIAANLKPSARGELEITDINKEYLRRGRLRVIPLEEDVVWMDAGNCDSMLEASQLVHDIQERDGVIMGCVERLAYLEGFITLDKVHEQGRQHSNTKYGRYLMSL